MVSSGDNSFAERRRLRKLENQRLEEAARQRQEELKAQHEADRKRLEDEKFAEEQRCLQEREEIVKKKLAEAEQIANIENEERQLISDVEKQLRLVGAFWTSTLELPPNGDRKPLPLCATVLTARGLESSIQGVEDDVIFIADNTAKIHAYDRKTRSRLFSTTAESFALQTPSAMTTTRCGRLLVCDQESGRVALIELRVLFQLYRTCLLFIHARDGNPVEFDATTARKMLFDGNSQLKSPRGLAVDDAAGEIYVSDETKNCIRVYKLPKGVAVFSKGNGGGFDRSIADDPSQNILKRPGALDTSHYHIVVCDVGNSRLVIFAKRGTFVLAVGCKGMKTGEFHDLRDVKLANVRKRAITRGVQVESESGVWNEHFEAIVADCGNFRVQILNERGEFLRQLSLLGSVEQVAFQREQFAHLRAEIAREYTKLRKTPPILSGESMKDIYSLATVLHPSCQLYARLMTYQMEWRQKRSHFHHPFALAYASSEKEVVVVDRENAGVYTYSFGSAGCNWLQLTKNETQGVRSVHSSLWLTLSSDTTGGNDQTVKNVPMEQWLYVSDPIAHRVAVFDTRDMTLKFFIGATTYGDQEFCSNGFLPGELNSPSFLTTYNEGCKNDAGGKSNETEVRNPRTMLVVSDSGNHSVSIFDACDGSFCGRIGESFGHLDGFLDTPQGVAVWDNRLLYVCDQHNHRVQVFDLVTRYFVRTFGRVGVSPGEFNFPTGLAICPGLPDVPKCDFGPHRYAKVVVADTGNCRVQVLDLNGCVQLVLDAKITPFDQPLSPVGVWVEQRSGYLLVSDVANRCVAIFTNSGNFVTAFGATGEVDARFIQPMGLVIVSQTAGLNLLLVADAMRCDVSTFQLRL